MYAVVTTGGKQFRLAEGDRVRVARIDAPVGDTIELDKVCLLAKEDGLVADAASLASARVVCEVVAHDRAKKIRVFKKKRKKNYTRTQGHRQDYTELKIQAIKA